MVKNKQKLWSERMKQLDREIAASKSDLADIHQVRKQVKVWYCCLSVIVGRFAVCALKGC